MRPTALLAASAIASVALLAVFGLIDPGWVALLTGAEHPGYPIAASIDLVGLDGNPITSDDLRGDILVLEFWATWCGPCIGEINDYNALQAAYADDGVRVLGVAVRSGTTADIEAFAREHDIRYPIAIGDDVVWRDFGPMWGVPTTLLIDRDWKVRRAWVGAGGTKMEALRASLDAVLAEERSSPRTRRRSAHVNDVAFPVERR